MALKSYFYGLLSTYIGVFVRPGDRVIYVDPDDETPRTVSRHAESRVLRVFSPATPGTSSIAPLTSLDSAREWRPDYIVVDGNIHVLEDVQALLSKVQRICVKHTRVILLTYSSMWRPVLQFATLLGVRRGIPVENWLAPSDIVNFATLTGLEVVQREPRILLPIYVPLLSKLINRWIAPLPFWRLFCLMNIAILRSRVEDRGPSNMSVSVVVPARDEAGNIQPLFERMPSMGPNDEIILVEGHSEDETWKEIQRCSEVYKDRFRIKITRQDGVGKADAVYKGFAMTDNEILMILDSDLSVAPEELPRFYEVIASGMGEFVNGSRLVYPMEKQAMRFLNMTANKFFAWAFSYVLGQDLKDTLCGTKVLLRSDWERIHSHREFFGDFDPFGDFDLLFGASRLGMKTVEVPIRYRARTYGETIISRWRHGLLLFQMLAFSARRLKFV